MSAVKRVDTGRLSQITCPAPSRSLAPSVSQTWQLTEQEGQDEQELLERVQCICREYGQRYASQVSISSHQVLPPESVSMFDPPERAWLIRLQMVGPAWSRRNEHLEMIAVRRGDEVRIILR